MRGEPSVVVGVESLVALVRELQCVLGFLLGRVGPEALRIRASVLRLHLLVDQAVVPAHSQLPSSDRPSVPNIANPVRI